MKKYTVRKQKSGSGMFLMEMIVAVFFFVICASLCILAFSKSDHMSRTAKNLNQAVLAAESAAEVYNAAGADGLIRQLSYEEQPSSDESAKVLTTAYDRDWKLTDASLAEDSAFRGFIVTAQIQEQSDGEGDLHIEVCMAKPSGADQAVIYTLDTVRYERCD